jgi:ATP-binding cassette subfamily B protein
MVIARLEQVVGFVNRVMIDAPRLREFFAVLDTVPAVRDRPDAIDPGRVRGTWSSRTCRSPTTASDPRSPT